ncbi:hypothetical protein JW979_07985 [bacterium]|nr:hypothetical protein [candidate division CSSED10-310 bacterium]
MGVTHHFIARFETDGTLDSGFGSGGIADNGRYTSEQADIDIAIQNDHKILLGSHLYDPVNNPCVFRFLYDPLPTATPCVTPSMNPFGLGLLMIVFSMVLIVSMFRKL